MVSCFSGVKVFVFESTDSLRLLDQVTQWLHGEFEWHHALVFVFESTDGLRLLDQVGVQQLSVKSTLCTNN